MGYLSNVKIAVCLNDCKDFIKNLSDRNYISKYCDNKTQFFLGNRKKYQEDIIKFVNDAVKDVREGLTGVEYQTLEWDGVKWYETEFIEIAYIMTRKIKISDYLDADFNR